jgi:Protein of unknown function (DUF669)
MALTNGNEGQAAALARFDDEWTKTSVSSNDVYSDIPDGSYDAVIEEARLSETASTGRPMLVWKLRLQGPGGNRIVTKNRVITENTIVYLKEELEKCQLKISSLSQLPARLGELADRPIGVEKRTKDGQVNFYFRRTDRADRGGQNSLDDIPF